MNALSLLAKLEPFRIGESSLLNWLLTLLVIAIVVTFVVWLVTKFAGPPNIPQGARWIIWIVAAVGLLIFIFAALGISLP